MKELQKKQKKQKKQKMKKLLLSVAIGLSFFHGAYADVTPGQGVNITTPNIEHVTWDGTPISIMVPVGEERLISFAKPVEFKNMNPALTSDKVAITNNNGTLYIRALQPFSPIRTYVSVKSSGQIVYLDLSAQSGGDDNPVSILTASPTSNNSNTPSQTASNTASPTYVAMLQYAVAQLYWPERLISQLNQNKDYFNFARTPMYTTHSVHLIMGNNVLAIPEASWRNGDLFVTAVLLLNPNKEQVNLDPFNGFIGNWDAKAFYPTNYLTEEGTANDRTVVFLVSDQPFNSALNSTPDYR